MQLNWILLETAERIIEELTGFVYYFIIRFNDIQRRTSSLFRIDLTAKIINWRAFLEWGNFRKYFAISILPKKKKKIVANFRSLPVIIYLKFTFLVQNNIVPLISNTHRANLILKSDRKILLHSVRLGAQSRKMLKRVCGKSSPPNVVRLFRFETTTNSATRRS